ncbi:MAG: hypothetical protein IT572_05200 [Deltaproteobacteria bacterium]|nr:hypothetical protein [Deltaproteobacteria bacterium]
MLKFMIIILAGLVLLAGSIRAADEHAGKEHAGKEHAGEAAKGYSAAEIKVALTAHIETAQAEGNGVFKIVDKDRSGRELKLRFVKIHDPVRKIEGKGYFACSDFRVDGGETEEILDLDFWLNPKDGRLVVTETKIHKDAVKVDGKWTKKERYTFVNDKPVEVR